MHWGIWLSRAKTALPNAEMVASRTFYRRLQLLGYMPTVLTALQAGSTHLNCGRVCVDFRPVNGAQL